MVDNLDIENLNYVNLRAATSAALLLLPSEFTEVCCYWIFFQCEKKVWHIQSKYSAHAGGVLCQNMQPLLYG